MTIQSLQQLVRAMVSLWQYIVGYLCVSVMAVFKGVYGITPPPEMLTSKFFLT